nr:hypothetical protein Iba_chr11aCG8080 [Ipomoea batatas]
MVKRSPCKDQICKPVTELLAREDRELTVAGTKLDNAIPPALQPRSTAFSLPHRLEEQINSNECKSNAVQQHEELTTGLFSKHRTEYVKQQLALKEWHQEIEAADQVTLDHLNELYKHSKDKGFIPRASSAPRASAKASLTDGIGSSRAYRVRAINLNSKDELSSSPTPSPGPPMFANAFRHLAAAILTLNDLSPIPVRIMIRNASVYAEEGALPPDPSKAF